MQHFSRMCKLHGNPTDSTESVIASMKETKLNPCLCKNEPCNCGRMNGVNGQPLGFSLSVMNNLTALPPSPDLAYLLSLQSLTHAHFNNNNNNNNNINNNNNNNSSSRNNTAELPKRVTTSPQVSSSNQLLSPNRRRKRKDPHLRADSSKRSKSSCKRDNHQSEEKRYHCDFCGDSFGYKHVLQNHVRTHTGEKPFQCLEPECGKRFTRDHHLKTHMRLHTGEKPFKCDYCDKKFVQVANLRRHMRVHTGERPYSCDLESCQAKFSDSNQLNAHRLSHRESKPMMISNGEIDVKPLTRPIFLPYYQYLSHHTVQEEPEDLSLKKNRLILP